MTLNYFLYLDKELDMIINQKPIQNDYSPRLIIFSGFCSLICKLLRIAAVSPIVFGKERENAKNFIPVCFVDKLITDNRKYDLSQYLDWYLV